MDTLESPTGPRLVASLGLPQRQYSETTYALPDGRSAGSCFCLHALAKLLRPAEIWVLTTQAAWDGNQDVLRRRLAEDGLPAAKHVLLDAGSGNEVLWAQFRVWLEAIRVHPDREVILDVTFGFRSLPFLAAGVVAYARAVWEQAPSLRILYGALEARGEGSTTPVWDLTPLMDVLGWSQGIHAFLRSGLADEVAKRTYDLAGMYDPKVVSEREARRVLDRLAGALTAFGQDLVTVRTGDLVLDGGRGGRKDRGSALGLVEAVEAARSLVGEHQPALADVMDRIVALAGPLSATDLRDERGREALAALARVYLDMGRYAEAASTTREAWVTRLAAPEAAIPGRPGFSPARRHDAERAWTGMAGWTAKNIASVRNDIEHAGYSATPMRAARLTEAVSKVVEGLDSESESEVAPCPSATLLINLTHHPVATWEAPQREAALEIAQALADLPFPEVPPEAEPEEVAALCEQTLCDLPAAATHAVVHGEPTLVLELIRALQRRGITCFAAATSREVEDLPDGRKVSRYRFVRFREYRGVG